MSLGHICPSSSERVNDMISAFDKNENFSMFVLEALLISIKLEIMYQKQPFQTVSGMIVLALLKMV